MKKAKEDWIGAQCEEIETCLNKNNSKRAYQLVKDLTSEKQGRYNYPGQVWEMSYWLGVKRVTEPNRTEPPDYTGQSLRKFPILAVPGFTAVTRTELFGVISNNFFKSNYAYFKIYLFKYNLLCL